MIIEVVKEVFLEGLSEYSASKSKLRQCLPAFEQLSSSIIEQISKSSRSEADELFDQLEDIQGFLCPAVYVENFDVGKKLNSLVREFDRLHDPKCRDFWYDRIQSGERWPNSP